ncbi:hypothetical protein BDV23DRAFT_164783 [Aspergillus alliaceus]|uniref:Uncharacterized protein n=1 Tax=Petromyces alliaceus TaxID=209559 RepID=A0A5N7BV49_PETAA|nr:hypothetical protein BDV23DRAFT_164783 [Aspergillus alliaceus]
MRPNPPRADINHPRPPRWMNLFHNIRRLYSRDIQIDLVLQPHRSLDLHREQIPLFLQPLLQPVDPEIPRFLQERKILAIVVPVGVVVEDPAHAAAEVSDDILEQARISVNEIWAVQLLGIPTPG